MNICHNYTSTHVQFMQTHIDMHHMIDMMNTQTTRSNNNKCKLNLNDGHCKFETKRKVHIIRLDRIEYIVQI